MAVRDQLQAQLIAAGQQLQRMAPWGQEADSQDDTAAQADTRKQGHRQQQEQPQNSKQQAGKAELSSSSWLLRAAATKAPGHFSSSLAELWPLQPVLGLRGATAAGGNSSSSSKGRCGWLRAASWPSSELSWLLHGPPAHLPAVQQLLASALIQPVRTRVSWWRGDVTAAAHAIAHSLLCAESTVPCTVLPAGVHAMQQRCLGVHN
jgi:hypothetical protein